MVELNRVDEIQRFRTYKIYGKHHLPHYGEHKLVATVHMNTGDNSLADCESLPVLFMNAQTYRNDAMRLRNEIEQKDREISRLQAAADLIETQAREIERLREALQWMVDNDETNEGDEPIAELGGKSWDEINAYWIDGLNRARAALAGDSHDQ